MPAEVTELDLDELLLEASRLARYASTACKNWELGGPPEAVSDTAADVLEISGEVLRISQLNDGEPLIPPAPETRRGRILASAWLLVLAGTDEHGESGDLAIASRLFKAAAMA